MKKRYALIFSLMVSLLAIISISLFTEIDTHASKEIRRENIILASIVDGDTLKTEDGKTLRLVNINAPEKGTPNYRQAIEFLSKYVNKSIEAEYLGEDKYQRTLARLYAPEYLNLEIVSLGLASKFLVDESELKEFAKAEKSAIARSIGIWNNSEYFGCFDSGIDSRNELIVLKNNCPKINLVGWYLKDESRKTYTFKKEMAGILILHSGAGEDNSTDLFWNSKENIWNNDRDSLYLFDSEGRIVHYEAYGY
ncbi:MAG: thermonuclease family protein [archaeon]|jgi:endonuclease YncB( thermonuclease family)|nr:thermonuclease family protein [archaeon]